MKPLAGGGNAVALFNRDADTASISTTAREAGLPGASRYQVRDLWQHSQERTAGDITAVVPSHGVAVLRVGPAR